MKKVCVFSTISGDNTIKLGGALIIHYLYKYLAKYYYMTLLFFSSNGNEVKRERICDNFEQITIPKTGEFKKREKELNSNVGKAVYDVSFMYYMDDMKVYENIIRSETDSSDIIIVDRPFLFEYALKFKKNQLLLHRSQNVEYIYKKCIWDNNIFARDVLQDLFEMEKKCCRECDVVFACSETDIEQMELFYGRKGIQLLPNGIDISENEYISYSEKEEYKKRLGIEKIPIAVFCGGLHKPNVEAVESIIRIASMCPNWMFLILGNVCKEFLNKRRPYNVYLCGAVTEKCKKNIYKYSDVALNMMYSGSGANVKMADYMASGIPIISTMFGSRGIKNKDLFLHAESDNDAVDMLNRFKQIDKDILVEKAYNYACKEMDWPEICKKTVDFIERYEKH